MNATNRRKLSMGNRALDFAQANPSTDASYIAVVADLETALTRGNALAVQQRDGTVGEQGALDHRDQTREEISQQLHHLARVASRLDTTDSELANQFTYPDTNAPNRTFLTAATAMLAAATPQKDALIKLGLGETFLDDLSAAITEFDAATTSAHGGRRAHVGAVADLTSVADECVRLVGVLDGLNRARFRDNPELLAAWESSVIVAGPFRSRKKKQLPVPPTPDPVVPPPVPPSGEKNA